MTTGDSQLALYRLPDNAIGFLNAKKTLARRYGWLAVIITAIMGGLYLVANGNIALPIAPFVFFAIVIVLWCRPDALLPLTVFGACFFETYPLGFADSFTDRVPLFWDINTTVQQYAHVNYHGLPLSMYELFLILGLSFALIRAVYDKQYNLKAGALFPPILAYVICVAGGYLNGIATGGDFKIALFEVRAQIYFMVAYLLAINAKGDPREVATKTIKLAALCIGIKGLLLTIRYFITLGGHTDPDTGVGSHEESFFFDCFVMLFAVLKLGDIEPQTRRMMLFFMPFVLIANLANERRAATAAMVIAVPVLLTLALVAFPNRRKLVTQIIGGMAVAAAIYLPIFWNADGPLAQPARAVRSQFSPSDRDQSSDIYRQAEDVNLMFTMRSSPIIGYGYGKPIHNITGMVDLTAIDPLILYLTHDQILWVWMRLGFIGFVVFWLMFANFFIRMAQTAGDQSYGTLERTLAVYASVVLCMLLLFGLYDLQLSNVRDMLFTAVLVGFVGWMIQHHDEEEEKARIRRMKAVQRQLFPSRGRVVQTPGLVRVPTANRY